MPRPGAGHHEQYGRADHQPSGYCLVSDQDSFSLVHTHSPGLFQRSSTSKNKNRFIGRSGFPLRRLFYARLRCFCQRLLRKGGRLAAY
jgi:hypothetical protein